VEHVLLLEPRSDDAFAGVYEAGTTLHVRRVDVEGAEAPIDADGHLTIERDGAEYEVEVDLDLPRMRLEARGRVRNALWVVADARGG